MYIGLDHEEAVATVRGFGCLILFQRVQLKLCENWNMQTWGMGSLLRFKFYKKSEGGVASGSDERGLRSAWGVHLPQQSGWNQGDTHYGKNIWGYGSLP